MKTKFKYFKCLMYSRNRIEEMYEQGEISDKMYSNLLAAKNRQNIIFRISMVLIILIQIFCGLEVNIFGLGSTIFCNSVLPWKLAIIVLLGQALLETYFGTKGIK